MIFLTILNPIVKSLIIHAKLKFKLSKKKQHVYYFVIKFDYFLLLKIINLSDKFNLN